MSSTHTWQAFDEYAQQKLFTDDSVLKDVLQRNAEEGLPSIDVSPNEGKMLHLFAKMVGAKRILEIGTLGGYSSIWLARSLPEGGKLVSLEYSSKHAAVAEKNIQQAGLSDRVDILVGAALDSLPTLPEKGYKDFDFIFIDADKRNNPRYVQEAINLSHPGTCIVVDNVVRNGQVLDRKSEHPDVKGIRDMFDYLAEHPNIDSTAIQTVGSKGYDGFLLAIVQ